MLLLVFTPVNFLRNPVRMSSLFSTQLKHHKLALCATVLSSLCPPCVCPAWANRCIYGPVFPTLNQITFSPAINQHRLCAMSQREHTTSHRAVMNQRDKTAVVSTYLCQGFINPLCGTAFIPPAPFYPETTQCSTAAAPGLLRMSLFVIWLHITLLKNNAEIINDIIWNVFKPRYHFNSFCTWGIHATKQICIWSNYRKVVATQTLWDPGPHFAQLVIQTFLPITVGVVHWGYRCFILPCCANSTACSKH